MSLNDLPLSSSLIATLYSNSLISVDVEEPFPQNKKPSIEQPIHDADNSSWKSLGNNLNNVLIVVNYNKVVHLPDEELGFLTGMLTACKLSLDDVAIINANNYKTTNYKEILTHFKSKVVFLFGVAPADFGLPVNFPFFQVQPVSNATFLYTPALEQRNSDGLFKSRLWVSLRSIFRI